MHSCFVVAISGRIYSAAIRLFCFRPTIKQTGLVLALLVAGLIGSVVRVQANNVPKPETDVSDEGGKRRIEKTIDPATKARSGRLTRTTRLVSGLPLAQTAGISTAKRDSTDLIARYRTQKKNPFAKFENLLEKGTWFNMPGPANTISQDNGGVRSALAEVGIGYVGWTLNSVVSNVLPNAGRTGIADQHYIGQNPTFSTANSIIVTYDLSRFGIPDGQFIVGAEQQYGTWKPAGPDSLGIHTLAYYQTFFDRKLELKAGYLRNQYEFAGAGENVFGPSSKMLYQVGMSNNFAPAPALNVKYNFDDRFYNKLSIQRSLNPGGQYAHITENPSGLNWSTTNAGVLLLDEICYKSKAAPGLPETWLRAGAGFNNSSYANLHYPKQSSAGANSVYYLAADRQLWQSDVQSSASRGIYGGFSAIYFPPELNKVSQYYELRLYAKGLFDSRPSDQMNLVIGDTASSHVAVDAALAKGQLVHRHSTAISGLYIAHLAPGIYTSVGLTYINNPTSVTHTRQTGHALNLLVATSIFF